ncbi:MAG TPA: DUF559 domain-containing protein [Nocardioidaceae bacterium]|nr:DUF559 domain-containing protein [Nocardioidaceae bacterium]
MEQRTADNTDAEHTGPGDDAADSTGGSTGDEAVLELDQRRPFTRADAVRAHVSPKILRTSLFRRIFRGVYIRDEVPDSPLVRAEAALMLHPPTAFASHTTAARICKLPIPTDPFEHVTVFRSKDRRQHEGIRTHVTRRNAHVIRHRGIRVSHPYRMFVELASMLSLVDLVVVADALIRLGDITPGDLVQACEASDDRYARTARTAARYARAGVDSPMETRLRLLLVLAGIPEPVVNHTLYDEAGRVLRRLDLSYPELRLIVEYDGRHHIERTAQWESDLERREEFDEQGLRILVVTAKGVYREPERTIDRVRTALAEAGCRGLPTRLSDGWRQHFLAQR